MRVFVAGATGAIGRELVAQLAADGHDVTAFARSAGRAQRVADLGATVVTGNALDRDLVMRAVSDAKPDAIVNLLTALPAAIDPKHVDRDLAATNRLRTEGARNLFDAGAELGVERHVVESIAFIADPSEAAITDESAPLWERPPAKFAAAVQAVRDLEQLAEANGATVLRFGHLYGPGTAFAPDGSFVAALRAGKVPLVGGGRSMFSFVHTADAASAVVAALGSETPGVFNVVDDEPAAIGDWLPYLAKLVGAPAPKRVPAWVARLAVGDYGVAYMTSLRGSSNQRAKEVLGWQPLLSSWREGFAVVMEPAERAA